MADPLPVIAGVAGPEPAIEGRVSSNEAPNEDVGLKGFNPANPVRFDLTGEMGDVELVMNGVAVAFTPVVWSDSGVKNKESGPFFEPSGLLDIDGVTAFDGFVDGLLFANAKDDATPEMSTAPGLSEL